MSQAKTTADVQAEIEALKLVHPQEIGCRVGEKVKLLEEIVRLRMLLARQTPAGMRAARVRAARDGAGAVAGTGEGETAAGTEIDETEFVHAVFDRIREVIGEFCEEYVFIGSVVMPDGINTRTVSKWAGGFNAAIGLARRVNERMRQEIIENDYPDEPPEGEDWKEKV